MFYQYVVLGPFAVLSCNFIVKAKKTLYINYLASSELLSWLPA